MKNFRLNLENAKQVLTSSACEIKNPALSDVLTNMAGGVKDHLKAHGDVSWDKNSATLQPFE